MSAADMVILVIVAVLIIGTIVLSVYNRRHGKTGCGGHCAGCAQDCPHRQKPDETKDEKQG